jgi:hypothetical protein
MNWSKKQLNKNNKVFINKITMKNIEKHIDEIVSKVLAEAINFKANNILNMAKNGINEELHGGQKKIDVAEPKGKITAADFEKLRSKKQKPRTQAGFEHGEIVSGDVDECWDDESDGQGWSEANKLSKNEPLYRGTKFVKEDINEYSFGDTETDDDLSYNDMLPSSKDEKQIKTPHKVKNVGDKYQRKVSKEFNEENILKKMFGKKEDPEVAREKDREENPYLGNSGYEYDDIRGWHYVGPGQGRFDNRDSEDVEMEESKKFPDLSGDGKVTRKDVLLGRGVKLKESIQLTEDELIDLIEKIVNEQTTVPVTNKSLKSSKTENDDYIKSVTKKMQTYLKDASKGKYDMNPTQFPKGNGELAKMAKKAYTPSSAVEEYIENFAYSPGMENLQYDEIKPNEDWLEANIEGSSKTGNGAGGNAIDTGLGKKINAKRKKNLYGAEKNKSYNRVPQPVDQAGEETHNNTLDSMFKKLGESEDKQSKLINEEMDKMKHLLGYKKKTQ